MIYGGGLLVLIIAIGVGAYFFLGEKEVDVVPLEEQAVEEEIIEEEEEVKIENENHRLIQKPSPPLKIDVVRADIAQIFINSGRWEEVRHGFVRLVRELGVKLLPDKKRSREQLNDSEIDTSSPDESSDFEPIKKQRI